MLGDLPARTHPIAAELIALEDRETYVLEVLLLDLNGVEPVPAYFTRPRNAERPFPAVVYNHAHGDDYVLGKDEYLLGRSALQSPPYADALSRRGIAGLCTDAWNFGERRGRTESELFNISVPRGSRAHVDRSRGWSGHRSLIVDPALYDSHRLRQLLQIRGFLFIRAARGVSPSRTILRLPPGIGSRHHFGKFVR